MIGLPGSGKSTCFRAVTGKDQQSHGGDDLAVVQVPDERLEPIAEVFDSAKATPPEITFVDLMAVTEDEDVEGRLSRLKSIVGDADAFVLVIQAFGELDYTGEPLDPRSDLETLMLQLALTDLEVVENRLKRIHSDATAKKDRSPYEIELLERCREHLADGGLMLHLGLSEEDEKFLRGFNLLTSRPMLVVFNVAEDDSLGERAAEAMQYAEELDLPHLLFSGELEEEIAQLPPEDQQEFLADFGLEQAARDRFIKAAYELLNVITFFTASEKETRGWTIPQGANAQEAAAKIHTDMGEHFIRAEVIPAEALIQRGSVAACREHGEWSLQGADYIVEDGDILQIRFSH
ncbi:MAG: DUF933 domain-containing protein [Armatimonadota bacterium]